MNRATTRTRSVVSRLAACVPALWTLAALLALGAPVSLRADEVMDVNAANRAVRESVRSDTVLLPKLAKMTPTPKLAQSVQMARVLSGQDTPLLPLMRALSRETTLGDGRDIAAKVEDKALGVLKQKQDELKRWLGSETPASPSPTGVRIESIVDDRFAILRQLVDANRVTTGGFDGAAAASTGAACRLARAPA